ncbi:MAG TPA: glucuronate isomerase [Mycobacteriales bacterium]|nr:glucuronate isomerase [Mycobacteriales bacterium]
MAASPTLSLHPDRLFPADPSTRTVARRLFAEVDGTPIVSPHGHVDAAVIADDTPFPDPATLFVVPDHYITRLLHAQGIALEDLGVAGSPAEPREIWRKFCAHWKYFRATPSRYWLEGELVDVFGVDTAPSAETADALFDELDAKLRTAEFRPRALFEKFKLAALATTDDPADALAAHRKLTDDPSWSGRVVPTFRPDAYLDPSKPGWPERVTSLGAAANADVDTYDGYIEALQSRRAYFKENGATATDHGHLDAGSEPLELPEARRIFTAALTGTVAPDEATAFRRHMLSEMARMACDDGLVMQLHPCVLRDHHTETFEKLGPDTGHDIPLAAEFTRSLRPLLQRYGTHPNFRMVLFTTDEDVWAREIAPLAGFYPSLYVGAPWWYTDTPDAMRRFREAVTDTVGFYRTSGFIDDTRAFCSIPVRHDTARRVDAGHLARLVVEHRMTEEDAADTIRDLAYAVPHEVFRL